MLKTVSKKHDILINRDSLGKIRIVDISLDWNDDLHAYLIQRKTGIKDGKIIEQPVIEIKRGLASRSVTEQAILQYKSNVKKYLDKGYKNIKDFGYSSLDDFNPDEVLSEDQTDSNGFKKHMLAKSSNDVATSLFDKLDYWWASRKIDGCRASFYWKDDKIHTASRGGGDYDAACQDFINHPKFIKFFKKHPDIILDGEMYKFGLSLQQISGCIRTELSDGKYDLEYYIYDTMTPDKKFEDRLKELEMIKEELNLGFEPEREWNPGDLRIQMVPQEKVSGWNNIKKLHDKYVNEGWEGLVIRDPSKNYKYGGRTNNMIKVKERQEETFTIVGYELGLRGVEDMVFKMKTQGNIEFFAKPMGSREVKENYMAHMNELIGKKADCTFFYLSDDGVPLQSVFKAVRLDL